MPDRRSSARPVRNVLPAVLGLCALLLVCGCASRQERAAQLAAGGGFQPLRIETGSYVLQGWLRPGRGSVLCVYIEGDGLAWIRRNRPSDDPTPTNPEALRLALADPAQGPVLYLARPCQYTEGADRRGCSTSDWTDGRFSELTVAAMDEAVTQIKTLVKAEKLALHGYSGGGGMVALLAARRHDVVFLATVAGNLDHRLWTSLHGDTALGRSLNPADFARATRDIPQLHVIGGKDKVIPASLLESWRQRMQGGALTRIVLPEAGHEAAWEDAWPGLLRQTRGF